MLISKFPDTKESKTRKNRQLLTKPSSWAKLLCLVVLVMFISWLNLRSENNVSRDDGKVAGVKTQAEQEEKSVVKEETKPQSQIEKPKKLSKLEEMIGKTDDLKTVLIAGKKFMDDKRYSDAQLAFLRATELAPDYRDVWYLLAISYISEYNQNPVIKSADYSLSKLDRAIFALTRAQLLDPQSEKIKQLLDATKQAKGK